MTQGRDRSSELTRRRVQEAAFRYFTDRDTQKPAVRRLFAAARTNSTFVKFWYGDAENLIKLAVNEQFAEIIEALRDFETPDANLETRAASFSRHVTAVLNTERARRFLFAVLRDVNARPWLSALYRRLEEEISSLSREALAPGPRPDIDLRESAINKFFLKLVGDIVLKPLLPSESGPTRTELRDIASAAAAQLLSGTYYRLEYH